MLINREWKHSFESSPSNSVTSLVSLWDLMFDKDGISWFEGYSGAADDAGNFYPADKGCHLEHDLICYNKNLYQEITADTANHNVIAPFPTEGVPFDKAFDKSSNEYLFGTFGLDISIPYYSPAARPTKFVLSGSASNFDGKALYMLDKSAVIPYGNTYTFSINSIVLSNSWGMNAKIQENSYLVPMYGSTLIPLKVGPYDESKTIEQMRAAPFDIWLKGKNTQFAKDNELEDFYDAYNYVCIDPRSNFAKMLIIRAISQSSTDFNVTGQPNIKASYTSMISSEFDYKLIRDVLENTFVWVRAPFFADYIKPSSYNQDLNKNSRVVHRDLILSDHGDFNEYNESIVAAQEFDEEESTDEAIPVDTNTTWIDTLPYISKTAPMLDFIKPKDLEISEHIGDDNFFLSEDITGIPIPTTLFSISDKNTTDNSANLFCPFIYWNSEYAEAFNENAAAVTDYFASFNKGRNPVFLRKYGNIFADGRIFSPTIDEIWTSIKLLICGRNDAAQNTNDFYALPKGTQNYRLSENHLIPHNNTSNGWQFNCQGATKIGDPLDFELGYYDSNGNITPTTVSDFINHNNTIDYKVYSTIKSLNEALKKNGTTNITVDYNDRKPFFLFDVPYNVATTSDIYEVNGVIYSNGVSNDTENFQNRFGPRPSPYSLREIEALVKGNRFNLDSLAIWLKKNGVINGKVTKRTSNSAAAAKHYSNEAKSGLYQFHRDYAGNYEENTQFVQNKSAGGFLQFDDNSKFATRYTRRENFGRKRISNIQNEVDTSQVFLAADGTWRYIFEKPRAQIVETTR